jgi:TatA/E family protein of Tat protein translocase
MFIFTTLITNTYSQKELLKMFENVGTGELLIILVVILLLFGSKKIPEIAQGLGKGIREFKKSIKEVEEQVTAPPKEKPDETKKT